MPKPIINIADVELESRPPGLAPSGPAAERFDAKMGFIGSRIGAQPAGGKETAHQIINSSAEELRYLVVSTKQSPEIVDYPDSGKFGILAELPAGADGKPQRFVFVGRENESLNYWEGE